MASRKKQLDAALDVMTADAVKGAVEFTATIRAIDPQSGKMRNFTLRRPTLMAAREVALKLEQGFANGRHALVYAISAAGTAWLVPPDFQS